jgi:excinuclease UvrABC nuclease subunit
VKAPQIEPHSASRRLRSSELFKLSPRDPAPFVVQRLRDEAHRFAIETHRARRKKEFVRTPLDEIPGVGPARKWALLLAFHPAALPTPRTAIGQQRAVFGRG